jgi:hypothetical protein
MGSNSGPFVQSCQAATFVPGTHWPWCVAFWVKAWTTAGYKLPYRGAGAYSFLDWHKQHQPSWVVPLSNAEPGAAVIFNIGSGHLAMLVSQNGGTVTTIGGNESDSVKETSRSISLVRGVVDPHESKPPPPARPPVFDVITSESGHKKLVYSSGVNAVSRKIGQILNRWGGVTIKRRRP